MGKIVLVTGGARSGKSSFAEKYCSDQKGQVLYIATAIPFDDEMKDRIKKHKEQRPKDFVTLECYRGFDELEPEVFFDKQIIMLDCVTIMITNILLDYLKERPQSLNRSEIDEVEKIIMQEIYKMLDVFKKRASVSVLVTNEIGMGIVPENALSRMFRDIAGRANQVIAGAADEVYFCVSGIPMKIK